MHLNTLSYASLYLEVLGENLADGTAFRLGTGSAAVYKHPNGVYIITAKHVVTGINIETQEYLDKDGFVPRRLRTCFAHSGSLEPMWVESDLVDNDNNPLWLEHPTHSNIDVACVRLPNEIVPAEALIAPHDPYRRIVLEDLIDPEVRHSITLDNPHEEVPLTVPSQLFVIGFPFGARGTWPAALWVTGHVASEPDLDYDDQPYFLIDARTREGLSGAPVVRHLPAGSIVNVGETVWETGAPATELVGIYSGRLNEDADLGRVWRATVVRDILEANDPGPLDVEF